ncbi:hypothetical protein [Caballeronia humi]|uniref:Uncharacterized protein n=1 Tax=Caballeronia humi TaxID=326474 RepID=A0A158IDA9_9BURK|nr:hypothetical protein [Caballeronia humi]SAL54558.1 hypothetical protein AWB65_04633 [Caballeronia humi]
MRRQLLVRATEWIGDAQYVAEYEVESGNLCISVDGVTIHDLDPPDSWVAIASVATASEWGTRPDAIDLQRLLSDARFQTT